METKTYVHKAVEIEALQLTALNYEEVVDWCGGKISKIKHRPLVVDIVVPNINGNKSARCFQWLYNSNVMRGVTRDDMVTFTDERDGTDYVTYGDYIIKDGNRFDVIGYDKLNQLYEAKD